MLLKITNFVTNRRILKLSALGVVVGGGISLLAIFLIGGGSSVDISDGKATVAKVSKAAGSAKAAGSKKSGRHVAKNAADVKPAAPAQSTVGQDEELRRLKEENQRLLSQNESMQQQMSGLVDWMAQNCVGKYPLDMASLTNLHIPAVTEKLTLHPEVAKFLRVTPAEESMINIAFVNTGSSIMDLEEQTMTTTIPEEGKFVIHIPSAPQEGKYLREELYANLESALGGARFDRFLDVAGKGLEEGFHHFGAAAHTIIFQQVRSPISKSLQLVIKDGWISDENQNKRVIQATETTVDRVPDAYAMYGRHFPPELAAIMGTNSAVH